MEEWRDVVGFEGLYQISNFGNCKSVDRVLRYKNGKEHYYHGHMMKPVKCKNGYLEFQLNKDGKRYCVMAHRVVAMAFIPNPFDFPQINHKDEIITNNCVDNLEWCTSKYNANYGTRKQRCYENGSKKQTKPIYQISLSGSVIKKWNSIGDASRALGISDSQIIRVCKHKNNNTIAGGFKWEYA